MIAKKDLIKGGLYRGHHRCGKAAIWNEFHNRFEVIAFSMGSYYLEDCATHPEDDNGKWPNFVPLELIDLSMTDEECMEVAKANEWPKADKK